MQPNSHLKLSNLVNSEAREQLLTRLTFAQKPLINAHKESPHDATISVTAENSLQPKSRRLFNIYLTLIREDLRPGYAR